MCYPIGDFRTGPQDVHPDLLRKVPSDVSMMMSRLGLVFGYTLCAGAIIEKSVRTHEN
jgi:hypothetical protein